jgi:hypothetical protein
MEWKGKEWNGIGKKWKGMEWNANPLSPSVSNTMPCNPAYTPTTNPTYTPTKNLLSHPTYPRHEALHASTRTPVPTSAMIAFQLDLVLKQIPPAEYMLHHLPENEYLNKVLPHPDYVLLHTLLYLTGETLPSR